MLTSEDRTAGVSTFLLLLKGVDMATEEYSKASRKTQIENCVQSARREQGERVKAEKLYLALEEERKKSLGLIAEIEKGDSSLESARRANLQLVTEAERKQKQIDSLSGTVSGHSDTLSGLRQQVKSQTDVITKYKSCEVMNVDGSVGQAVASQARVASIASALKYFQERFERTSRDAIESQQASTKRLSVEIKAVIAQENAALYERVDHLPERVNELGLAHHQIAGQQGHEFSGRAPALEERIEYPQASHEVLVSAREQYEESLMAALQRLSYLWRKSEARLGLTVHKGFASWKGFILNSVIEDKRAFAYEGRVTSLHGYEGKVPRGALKAELSVWSDHGDQNARVNYSCLSNVCVDYSHLLWADSLEVEYEVSERGIDPDKFRSAVMVTPRVVGKAQNAAMEIMETIRKAEAQLKRKQQKSQRDRRSGTNKFPVYQAGYGSNEEEGGGAPEHEVSSNGGGAGNESDASSVKVQGGSRNVNAAQSMFDTSAEIDGDGGSDDEEDDGSDSHEEVNDEDLLNAREQLLAWNHPLHDLGSADIKRLSGYATKFICALSTAYRAHAGKQGKRSKNQMANVAKTWGAFPAKLSLTSKQKAVVKAYDKVAGMEGKAEGRRCSMDGYENESFEYFGPRDTSGGARVNIYLLNKKERTAK
jgi:hypothetical protein